MATMTQPMNPDATKPPGGDGMGGMGDAMDDRMGGDNGNPDSGPETFDVDLEAFGDNPPAEGATFKCKVISVDQDSGELTAAIVPTAKRGRGIQEAASEFEPGGGM